MQLNNLSTTFHTEEMQDVSVCLVIHLPDQTAPKWSLIEI